MTYCLSTGERVTRTNIQLYRRPTDNNAMPVNHTDTTAQQMAGQMLLSTSTLSTDATRGLVWTSQSIFAIPPRWPMR
jgi:hypothetical protein